MIKLVKDAFIENFVLDKFNDTLIYVTRYVDPNNIESMYNGTNSKMAVYDTSSTSEIGENTELFQMKFQNHSCFLVDQRLNVGMNYWTFDSHISPQLKFTMEQFREFGFLTVWEAQDDFERKLIRSRESRELNYWGPISNDYISFSNLISLYCISFGLVCLSCLAFILEKNWNDNWSLAVYLWKLKVKYKLKGFAFQWVLFAFLFFKTNAFASTYTQAFGYFFTEMMI